MRGISGQRSSGQGVFLRNTVSGQRSVVAIYARFTGYDVLLLMAESERSERPDS